MSPRSHSSKICAKGDENDVKMAFCLLQWVICCVCLLWQRYASTLMLPCPKLSFLVVAWQSYFTKVYINVKLKLMMRFA